MSIDREEVRRIAALARIDIEDDTLDRTAAQLSEILDFVATLRRLDLAGCEPSAFAPADAPLREDVPNGRRLSTESALAAAPAAEDGFFLVPPIVENLNP
jgi:aspartyl-tRNA(Asn)/glutamyl-tRNA(Gln) amidotransferase subunit C